MAATMISGSSDSTPDVSRADINDNDKAFFEQNGFLGPFDLCSPEEMVPFREQALSLLREKSRLAPMTRGNPAPGTTGRVRLLTNSHFDSPLVMEIARQPAIIERVASLLGPNLILWRSTFWWKEPDAGVVGWHRDRFRHVGPEPLTGNDSNIACWLAFDEVSASNSCIQIIPGSHLDPKAHTGSLLPQHKGSARALAPPPGVKPEQIVRMEMKPGQFFLFSPMLAHGSGLNSAAVNRIGLVMRMIPTGLEARFESPVRLISGKDTYGYHKLV